MRYLLFMNYFWIMFLKWRKLSTTLKTTSWIVCGDFNLPGYTWQTMNDIFIAKDFHQVWQVREAVTIIKNFVNRCQYKQSLDVFNSSGNCLDFDITDVKTNISNDPLVTDLDSAHPYGIIATACINKLKSIKFFKIRYNYNKMEEETINDEL